MVAADRISQLPEELLLLILSFLPTEYVVVTSLVSKRWRPLWLSVPTLDFDELRYLNRRPRYRKQLGFVNFMSTTIQARGSRQPIKEFRLTCYCEDHLTKRWLNEVIQCGVENIDVKCYPSFDLPSSIFNCATLVVLKLRWPFFENNDISSVYLPSLKTLHLKNAGFLKPQNFMALLYGCPILENLEANTVFFLDPSFEGEFKSFSKLVRAEFRDLGKFHIPVKVFSNVKFLSLHKCNDEDIPMFPNLNHLKLNLFEPKWNSVVNILICSPNLEIFELEFLYSYCLDWPNPQFVPQCIASQLRKCVITNYQGGENQVRFAKYVMQNSTSLRTMIIICTYSYLNDDQKEELASCSPRTCELLFK